MKKHRMTTKALSMLLTVIMLFSTISVGIIVPEAGLTASAAEEIVNVKDLTELRAAVTTASTNGSGKKTIIKLTENISSTTAQSTLGTFSNAANAVLDLAGHTLSFEYTGRQDYSGSQTHIQLPSDNANKSYVGTDVLPSAMINVASGATLQIINSAGSGGTISVMTDINDTADNTGGTTHQASSSVIKSAGTLIIGDPAKSPDAVENKVNIVANAAVRNTDDSGAGLVWELSDKGGSVHSIAVTVSGSSAVFKMYGGTIKAAGLVRTHRNGSSNHRVYALNIDSCSVAEIYGGTIDISTWDKSKNETDDNGYTVFGSTETAGDAGDSKLAAIRCNTNNLYIFDLDSKVTAKASKKTGNKAVLYHSNVYCTRINPSSSTDTSTYKANIYGGSFSYNLSTAAEGSTATLDAMTVRGSYAVAGNGSLSYTSANHKDVNHGSAGTSDGSEAHSCKFQTLFVHSGDDTNNRVFNGLNLFGYSSFKDYKSAVESATPDTDIYGIKQTGSPTVTQVIVADDDNSVTDASAKNFTCNSYNYKRNGYNQIGWAGKTLPGATATSSLNSTFAADIDKNGGTLFLEPVWEKNTYKITYDFGDGDKKYYAFDEAVALDYRTKYDEYNIEESMPIPVPERAGHTFAGWRVIPGEIDTDNDNSIGWDSNTLYGWDIATNQPAELDTKGHYGDITLVATWTPNTYTADINYYNANAERFKYQSFIPAEGKELVSTDMNGQTIHVADKFSIAPTRTEHHTFLGYYEAKAKEGSPSNWNGGKVTVLDDNGKALPDADIANQFAGKYGDVVFTPAFKAKEYTIKYYSDDETPILLATETYTIDDSNEQAELKLLDNEGFVFIGWQLRHAPNSTWQVTTGDDYYETLPRGAYGDIELYALCDYDTIVLNAEFYDEDGTTLLKTERYSNKYGFTGKIDSPRVGYDITGWTVIDPHPGEEGRWADTDVNVVNGITSLASKKIESVKLKAKYTAKTYTITFDTKDTSIPAPAPITYTIAGEFELPVLSKTAYDTPRWKLVTEDGAGNWQYFDAAGKDVTYLGKYNMTGSAERLYGNVKLEAVWESTKYTVSFNTNGGSFTAASGLDDTDVFRTNMGLDLKDYRNPNNITRNGYTFIGWDVEFCDETGWKGFREQIGDNKVTALPANKGYYGNITLIARWQAETYTIRFTFPEGVSPERPVDPITYTPDDTVITLPSAEDALVIGHTMKGWKLQTAKDGWLANDYGFSVAGGSAGNERWGNITLIADVEPTEYKIQYVDSEGNSLDDKVDTYHITDDFRLYDYKKPGYTTDGWYVFNEGLNTGSWRTESLYALGVYHSGMYGNVKLYPQVTRNEYTITLVDTNGAVLGEFPYNVEYTGTLPSDFTKTGQVLNGWQVKKVDSEDCSWSLYTFIAVDEEISASYGNVTLEAVWGVRSHTVTWKDGETVLKTESVNYGEMPDFGDNDPVKTADPDKHESYVFVGWSPEPQTVTADAVYKAVFKTVIDTYTVTWKDAGGAVLLTTRVKYGEHPVYNNDTLPAAPDGSYFTGWQDEAGNLLDSDTIVETDVTYIAQFAAETGRMITWKVNWKGQTKTYYTWWSGEGEPVWPYSNYLYTDNGRIYSIFKWVEDGNDVYSAHVSSTAISYTAVFDPQGGIFTADKVVSYNVGSALNMPQPTKPGYRFTGWQATPEGDGTWTSAEPYTEASYPNSWGDVTFTATWTIETYRLTIRTEDGETTQNYTVQSTYELPLLSKPGYTHTGWLVYSADNSNWQMGEIMDVNQKLLGVYGNIKVEPVWTARTYKINWVSEDTTITVEVKFGEAIKPMSPVAKNGYTAKWKEEIPSVMTTAADLTFNADYSAIKYYLKYNVNGGDTIPGVEYYITSEGELAAPVKEGSTFKGWKVTLSNGSWEQGAVYYDSTALKGNYGDVTLTAVWEINSYDITWIVGDVTTVTSWYYGTRPSYNGTPTKPSDDKVSYEFSGKWQAEDDQKYDNSAIPLVTGDATYEAYFVEVNRRYIVTWNIEGEETNQIYRYGDPVICPFVGEDTPTKPSTGDSDFIFVGWTPEITYVTGDITYTAIFEKHVRLQGITLSKTSVHIAVDATETITAILEPSAATSKDVEWVSNNRNIATVDENGKIYGVSAGETLVSAQSKDGRLKAYCLVTVTPVLAQYIVVSAAGASTTRLPGETVQLYATIMPENASTKVIRWTTSDPEVATVSTGGLVTFGKTAGSATITATADGYATGSITVTTTKGAADEENTYVIMFTQSSSSYIIAGNTYESISIVVKEGDTVEFLLTEPHFVTLNGYSFERDTDGVYRIRDIKENITVFATERPDAGLDEPEEPDNSGNKLSFFDKLKAFFRSIIEFFRGLFGG